MKNALVVGGANGIGLSIATQLAERDDVGKIYIVDKSNIPVEYVHPKFVYEQFDLTQVDYSLFSKFEDIQILMITAGFGRLSLFKDISDKYIVDSFNVNTIPVLRLIKHFYSKISSTEDFFTGVMVSIAGFMSSPFFSVYGASKAALKIFIESVNVELEKSGTTNRILNVSPGSIKGTSFNSEKTDLSQTEHLTCEILEHLFKKDDLYIPSYNEIFKNVLERYHEDFRAEGLHSYEFKLNSGRIH